MENKQNDTWQTLFRKIVGKQRRVSLDTAVHEANKLRTTVFSRCSLCKGCVSNWVETNDGKYCKSCHKLRFDKCEACDGCLDWHTLIRNDNRCSECYYCEHGSF